MIIDVLSDPLSLAAMRLAGTPKALRFLAPTVGLPGPRGLLSIMVRADDGGEPGSLRRLVLRSGTHAWIMAAFRTDDDFTWTPPPDAIPLSRDGFVIVVSDAFSVT